MEIAKVTRFLGAFSAVKTIPNQFFLWRTSAQMVDPNSKNNRAPKGPKPSSFRR